MIEGVVEKRERIEVVHVVAPQKMKLFGTKKFWKSVIHVYIELEIIPHLYRRYEHRSLEEGVQKSLKVTTGRTVIYALVSRDRMLLTHAVHLEEALKKEEALLEGYEWYQPTLDLWIDKNYHFLKAYQESKFDLALIVPAYFKGKSLMPNDRLLVTDGDSTIVIAKKDGATLVLLSGRVKA